MFDPDFEEEPYPLGGTLEEKALHSLEQQRRNFFYNKKNYLERKEGGRLHGAILMVHGHKAAEQMAASQELAFNAYLKNVMLDVDGNTTDPKYPTDKMIAFELRRIRGFIILDTSQFMALVESQMPSDIKQWNRTELSCCMMPYMNRYAKMVYKNITCVIPGKRLAPPSPAEVNARIMLIPDMYTRPVVLDHYTEPGIVINLIRNEIIELLLQDIPFNNKALEQKTELIADEKVPKKEEKKVLH